MREHGDAEIQCSSWSMTEDKSSKTRVIEYTHPVNAPMAPPMARAKKEQTCRRFGDHGLAIETRTYVSDVPKTDCFYVADLIRVEKVEGGKVSISMHFDVRFIQSTMFRTIITRTTNGEFERFMKSLSMYMERSLHLPEETPMPTGAALLPPPASSPPGIVPLQTPVFALLILILLLQAWILVDLQSIKQNMTQQNVLAKCSSTIDANMQVKYTSPDSMERVGES